MLKTLCVINKSTTKNRGYFSLILFICYLCFFFSRWKIDYFDKNIWLKYIKCPSNVAMLIHDFRVTLRQLYRLSSSEDVAALNFIWINGNLVISFNSLLRHQYWQLTTLSIWISSNTERSAFLSVTLNDICDSDFALLFYFIFFVYWFSYRKMENQIRVRPIKYLLALRVPHPYSKKAPNRKRHMI